VHADPSPDAVEANRRGMMRRYATVPWVEAHEGPTLHWFRTGRPFPMLNGILWAAFERRTLDAAIEHALAPFRERAVPMIWTVGPSSAPTDLGDRLVEHGLTLLEDEPDMAIRLDGHAPPATLDGRLELRTVDDDPRGVEVAHAVAAEVFGIADGVTAEFVRALADMGPEARSAFRTYLAVDDGVPVGTAAMALAGGAAGIYNVAVVERHRGRGLATALTLRALADAEALGYRVAVLGAAEIAYRLYRRIGFREVCRSRLYLWSPSDADPVGDSL
jgi:ribosomal protein S18 acetylase RimI-like enzyme